MEQLITDKNLANVLADFVHKANPDIDKMVLTKQQHMNLFRAIIRAYGVGASYGYPRKMSTDRAFIDAFGVFGDIGKKYEQKDIAPYWDKVVMGKWTCPLDNILVQLVITLVDWDKI